MSRWQVATRGAIVLGAALTVLATVVAGDGPIPPIVYVLIVAAAAAAAVLPDSHAPTALLVLLAWVWVVQADGDAATIRNPSTLLAAIGLATIHTASAFVAGSPNGSVVDAVVTRRWTTRSVTTVAATAAVWGAAVGFSYVRSTPSALAAAAALVVVAGAGLVFWRSTQPD